MRERVLITGINGFTGRYLAAELNDAGYEVFGLGNTGVSTESYKVVNLLDGKELLEVLSSIKPDYVVHLAAIAFVGHGSPKDFYDVNLIGTRNLLQGLEQSSLDLKRVLVASSANVYGNQTEGCLDETVDFNPANDYAISKVAMEYVCKLWIDRLPIVVARPFNYTGLGQSESFLIPKIVSHFKRYADQIELGNLDVERDFNDVRSVVRAYKGLLKSSVNGDVYNVCSGVSTSLRSIIASCEHLTGHQIKISVNPDFVRENEIKVLVGQPDKLRLLLPEWESISVKETLKWFFSE